MARYSLDFEYQSDLGLITIVKEDSVSSAPGSFAKKLMNVPTWPGDSLAPW